MELGCRVGEAQAVSSVFFFSLGLSLAATTLSGQGGLGLVFTSETISSWPGWAPQIGLRPGQGTGCSCQAIQSWGCVLGPQRIRALLWEGVLWGSAAFVFLSVIW